MKVALQLGALLLLWVFAMATGQDSNANNVCTGHYRGRSMGMRMEHQCLIIDQLRAEFQADMEDRVRRYSELNRYLEKIDGKLNQLLMDLDIEYFDIDQFKASKGGAVSEGEGTEAPEEVCDALSLNTDNTKIYRDCYDIMTLGKVNVSGVYPIQVASGDVIMVYCDMTSDGGGWTTIQKRSDQGLSFHRNWTAYRTGFGNPNADHWLGVEYIHQLSAYRNMSLRVDLLDWEGQIAQAKYLIFHVDPASLNYTLILDGYRGNAGDSLMYHNGSAFSTPDRDNDRWAGGSCGAQNEAGWWFNACSYAALNNKYYDLPSISDDRRRSLHDGILWYHWKEDYSYSLRGTEMKLRPLAAEM